MQTRPVPEGPSQEPYRSAKDDASICLGGGAGGTSYACTSDERAVLDAVKDGRMVLVAREDAAEGRTPPPEAPQREFHEIHPDERVVRVYRDGSYLVDHKMGQRERRSFWEAERGTPPTWRPIETAPKDGTEILLKGNNWIRTGYWAKRVERWSADAAVRLSDPTHWMPLPPAPPQSATEGR